MAKQESGRRDFDKLYLKKMNLRLGHATVDFLHRGRRNIVDEGFKDESANAFGVALGAYKTTYRPTRR